MTNTATTAGEKKFLDTHEAAEFLGFASFTLRKWRASGKGEGPRYFKVRSRVRYARADLEQFVTLNPRT